MCRPWDKSIQISPHWGKVSLLINWLTGKTLSLQGQRSESATATTVEEALKNTRTLLHLNAWLNIELEPWLDKVRDRKLNCVLWEGENLRQLKIDLPNFPTDSLNVSWNILGVWVINLYSQNQERLPQLCNRFGQHKEFFYAWTVAHRIVNNNYSTQYSNASW